MKITIHRPEQIGGQITRISTDKASIIIDLGHNLPNNKGEVDPLDNKEAIETLTAGCDAILYTHYHGDHIGLCEYVPENIPQYIGSTAKQIMLCKYEHMSQAKGTKFGENAEKTLESVRRMHTYEANVPMPFGNIKITPYFVSHSASDAHMFLIEIENKRILHTGDFRGHGLLSKGLDKTIKYYIKGVDVLIIEGTMLSRQRENIKSESELGKDFEERMKKYNYVFVLCSSTDMERLAIIKHAHDVTHKDGLFICDGYQKTILNIFSKLKGVYTSAFQFGKISKYSTTLDKNMVENGFTMLVRPTEKFHSYLDNILPMLNSEQTLFIYSMWDGYITREDTRNADYVALQKRFQSEEFPATVVNLHTSGHATADTLRKVCEKLHPTTAIIPIHRESGSDFRSIGLSEDLCDKVVTQDIVIDGIEITFND